ncbi:MAG: hypothetical protein LC112_11235 [Flavobacteriales bacterium]|nr:hypothetical protein [Flavobacteriales bacterium]
MDKSKIYLDLSKCTEEEQIKAIAFLPEPINEDDYDITHIHLYLIYDDEDCMWWVSTKYFLADKNEITYPEFIKLFEGGESKEVLQVENNGWIKILSETDLPKDEDEFWVFENNEVTKTKRKIGIDNNDYWWLNNITHYQPLIKPLPPKF